MTPQHGAPADLVEKMSDQSFAPQSAFSYPRDSWRRWLGRLDGLGDMIDQLPDALNRPTVTSLVAQHAPSDPVSAFVPVMIWGHGNSGYGPYRVARILTQSTSPKDATIDDAVIRKLRAGYQIAADQGAVEGYCSMNNDNYIKHLGPAFFTKWLHFATAANTTDNMKVAPILDQLVITWMSNHGINIRVGRTPAYAEYVELLSDWGTPYDLGPADVEERIFRLIRDAQAGKA